MWCKKYIALDISYCHGIPEDGLTNILLEQVLQWSP
jgi:hypothetical protein